MTATVNNGERFEVLDGLRGFAALAIAAHHVHSTGWAGYLAVDFFLILSGFVISHSYLYKRRPGFSVFVVHRLARLYPMHLFSLLVFIALHFLLQLDFPRYDDGQWYTLIMNVFLMHSIGLTPSGLSWNFPSWSISVEFWVNILFFIFVSVTTRSVVLALVSFFCFALLFMNTGHLSTHVYNYYGFLNSGMLRGIGSFLLGVLAYRFFLYSRSTRVFSEKYYTLFECLVAGLVLVYVFGMNPAHTQWDFVAPLLFLLLLMVFCFEGGKLSSLLKRFRYLGTISYSVYLNHISIILIMNVVFGEEQKNILLAGPSYVVILLVYSHFTYRFIERPAQGFIRSHYHGLIERRSAKESAQQHLQGK